MINIVAFIGPSGSGKSTLQQFLGYAPIVTWTTRQPRAGEENGKNYYFCRREDILQMDSEGQLLEYTEYNGNLYATDLDSIRRVIVAKEHRSIVVDANGVLALKRAFGSNSFIIGVHAPCHECRERLLARGEADIKQRLATYTAEVEQLKTLADLVINNAAQNWQKAGEVIRILRAGL